MAYSPYAYTPYGATYFTPQMAGQMQQPAPQIMPPQGVQPPAQMQMPQNQPAPMMGNQAPAVAQGNSGMIWISGYQAAADYLVAPNAAVALWDSSAPFVYVKKADASGKPTLEAFELVSRNPNAEQPAPAAQAVQLPDLSRFVTRDDVEEMISKRLDKPAKAASKKGDE